MTIYCNREISNHLHNVVGLGAGVAGATEMATTEITSLSGLRVLIVEDSWHVAVAVKSVLESVGMEIVGPAATIADAESLLTDRVPDLAVVDLNLHGEMAYSLIDDLIARSVPVLVASGYETFPDMNTRVAAVLAKPIRASMLLSTLRRIIKQRDTH